MILQFHHIDPNNKSFTLSGSYHTKSIEELIEEAKKCKLLCPNCHAKEHLNDVSSIISYYDIR